MVAIRDIASIKEKYVRKAQAASGDYRDGVESPMKDWASGAADAEESYGQGVQEAINRGAYGKGVKKAGTAKWQKYAIELGSDRYAPGVRSKQDDYEGNFKPFRDTLEKLTLDTPRGPRGSASNYDRVRQVGEALHQKRIQG